MKRVALALGLFAIAGLGLAGAPAGADDKKAPRFSHADHAGRGVAIDGCASCHKLGADGRAAPPTSANPHQPCASSGCHEDQFFAKAPTLCVVCHDGVDPSKKLAARYRPQPDSEFGGQINHKSHAGVRVVGRGGANGACVACHGDVYKKTRPAGGHAVCAPCHGSDAAPRMADCSGCHRRGAQGEASRPAASPWAVRARFDHGSHGADPRKTGTETRCVECHAAVPKAERMNQITAPTMASCDGCHDGKRAFKTTGFECEKCHAKAK